MSKQNNEIIFLVAVQEEVHPKSNNIAFAKYYNINNNALNLIRPTKNQTHHKNAHD